MIYKNILNFVSEEQIKNNKAKTIEAYNTEHNFYKSQRKEEIR